MYSEATRTRIMSGEKNDRNETGDWMMCPVCGRGDDDDADPGIWSCPSCSPECEVSRFDDRVGWELYPSCDMTTREG